MGMLLTCSNKGCYAQDYHKLDKDSGQVLCASCGNQVDVTQYVKTSLLAQGQIMRKPKPAMETKCGSCGSLEGPVILKFSKTLFKVGCKSCKEVNAHLTKYFLNALRMKSDIEVIQMDTENKEPEELAPVSRTAQGAVVINKPFTASTRPADRKKPVTAVQMNKAKQIAASQPFDDSVDDLEPPDLTERPKITVSKKQKGDAASKAEALRNKFVDKNTGDVSEAMKATLQINKV